MNNEPTPGLLRETGPTGWPSTMRAGGEPSEAWHKDYSLGPVAPSSEEFVMGAMQASATSPEGEMGMQTVVGLFSPQALQTPERVSVHDIIDTRGLSPDTIAALEGAQEFFETWNLEPEERAAFIKTTLEVGQRRDAIKQADTTKFGLYVQLLPQAQIDKDKADAEVVAQQSVVDETNGTYQDHAENIARLDHEVQATNTLIRTEGERRTELRGFRAIYDERRRELVLAKTADGQKAAPLDDNERYRLIVEGAQYGPLEGTEAQDNYTPGSAQEKARAIAVMKHVVGLLDAQIVAVNTKINEYELQLQAIHNERRAATLQKDMAHKALTAASHVQQDREFEQYTAASIYDDTLKLKDRIIGKPEEEFADEVHRKYKEKQAERAIAETRHVESIVFGNAGAISAADREAGREPLAIEHRRIKVSRVASRVPLNGVAKSGRIDIGFPQLKRPQS